MKNFETTLTVYPKPLVNTHAALLDVSPEKVNFDDAFEGEVSWILQSGIILKDYIVSAKKNNEFKVNALFDVDEDVLSQYSSDGLEDAFKHELGWLEESGIYLDNAVLA